MKILIVGSGGREHAIAWKVSQSPLAEKIYCAPGNAGIAEVAECVDIGAMEFDRLAAICQRKRNRSDDHRAWMTPWWAGSWMSLRRRACVSSAPERTLPSLEGSKAFSKDLMKKYHIPTAAYETFDDPEKAEEYLKTARFPIVLKADGLALGQGRSDLQYPGGGPGGRQDHYAGQKVRLRRKPYGYRGVYDRA